MSVRYISLIVLILGLIGCDDSNNNDDEALRVTENRSLNGNWFGHEIFFEDFGPVFLPITIFITENQVKEITSYGYHLDSTTVEQVTGTIFPGDEFSEVIFDFDNQAVMVQPSENHIIYVRENDIGLLEKKNPSLGDFSQYNLDGYWSGYHYLSDSNGDISKYNLSMTCNDNFICSGTVSHIVNDNISFKNISEEVISTFNAAITSHDSLHGIYTGDLSSSTLGFGYLNLIMSSDKKYIAALTCFGESNDALYCEYSYLKK